MNHSNAPCWVGIDVAQDWVDVAVRRNEQKIKEQRWNTDEEGLANLAKTLLEYAPQLITLEATGGLEVKVMASLCEARLPVCRVNPKWVRDFAKAQGLLAKTDRIDASVLAQYGERMRPQLRPLPGADQQELADLVARLKQLTDHRAMERTRLNRVTNQKLRTSMERVIDFLGEEIGEVEQQVMALVKNSAVWQPQERLLRSAPGIGQKGATTLLAYLPELGRVNRRQIAGLSGLAPVADDSGKYNGRRHIKGGRAPVRAALYLASWTAIRVEGRLRRFYQRLVAAGKPKQLALIAVARKLVMALNEMMRHGTPWRDSAPNPA